LDVREASKRHDEFTWLDVREWYEWESGTVEGARHIPIRALTERVDEVPQDRPVVVICQVGQRSALAAGYLNRAGYEAHNLEGGVEAWVADGLPLVSAGSQKGKVADGWAQEPDLPER
jgi:rhodanese-related sulfurtransferase